MKPLEALKGLLEILDYYKDKAQRNFQTIRIFSELPNYIKEIETALKDYEELEEKLGFDPTIFKQDFETLMKEHKALELLKRNLVIAFEEDNGIDLPTLVVGIKINKDKLCVIYSTQDKEEIRVLKEVFL